MYKSNVGVENISLFEKTLSNWGKIVDYMIENKMGRMKSVSHNLFFFLWEMRFNHNYKLNDDMIEVFAQKYIELENERFEKSLDANLDINLWYQLNRNVSKNIDKKVQRIIKDFENYAGDVFYKLDTVRNFKVEDKLRKCIETNGVVNRLDGSIEIITPLQSMDGNIIEGDHPIPHSKGGKTNPETNLELLIKEDNRKKSDKMLV
jgi:hypothetical protein